MTKQGMYFDRQGRPMSLESWLASMKDDKIHRIAETMLADGKRISTVWLGLNHRITGGPPLIFETMVFPTTKDFSELDMDSYATEAEALQGHEQMVLKWSTQK